MFNKYNYYPNSTRDRTPKLRNKLTAQSPILAIPRLIWNFIKYKFNLLLAKIISQKKTVYNRHTKIKHIIQKVNCRCYQFLIFKKLYLANEEEKKFSENWILNKNQFS